jgi:hypothetical protein
MAACDKHVSRLQTERAGVAILQRTPHPPAGAARSSHNPAGIKIILDVSTTHYIHRHQKPLTAVPGSTLMKGTISSTLKTRKPILKKQTAPEVKQKKKVRFDDTDYTRFFYKSDAPNTKIQAIGSLDQKVSHMTRALNGRGLRISPKPSKGCGHKSADSFCKGFQQLKLAAFAEKDEIDLDGLIINDTFDDDVLEAVEPIQEEDWRVGMNPTGARTRGDLQAYINSEDELKQVSLDMRVDGSTAGMLGLRLAGPVRRERTPPAALRKQTGMVKSK